MCWRDIGTIDGLVTEEGEVLQKKEKTGKQSEDLFTCPIGLEQQFLTCGA